MQFTPININPTQAGTVTEGGKSPFQTMREGQTIKAEVVEAQGSSLTLKMPDGTTVKADFPGAQVMLAGDKLELMMTSKSDGSVHLRLTSVNGQPVHLGTGDLQVRLMDMGIQPSEVNTKAAQFLVDRNIQPSPERVALLVKIAMSYPELPASAALFMAANDVPVTQENVNLIMQWIQGKGDLGADTQQLMNELMQLLDQAEPQAQAAVGGQAEIKAGAQEAKAADSAAPLPAGMEAEEGEQAQQTAPRAENMSEAEAKFMAALENVAQQSATGAMANATAAPQAAQAAQTSNAALTQAQQAVFNETFMTVINGSAPDNPVKNLPQSAVADFMSTLQNMSEGEAKQAIEGFISKFSLPPEKSAQATQTLLTAYQTARSAAGETAQATQPQQTLPGGEGQAQQGANAQQSTQPNTQTGNAQQSANGQNAANAQAANLDSAAVREVQQVLQTLAKFTVSMRRDVPADAENLQNAVKSQQSAADSVQSSLSRLMGEASAPAQRAADISSRIQLGNNIDNFYYCQIPIEIDQKKNTAELYVFERKQKGGEESRTNTTILIALETENMGRVETVMRSELEHLAIEFRVENDAVLKYLQKSTAELTELLTEGDFAVREVKVVRMDKPATPLNVDQVLGREENFQLQAVDISV